MCVSKSRRASPQIPIYRSSRSRRLPHDSQMRACRTQPFLVAKTETPVSKKTESEAPINHCIGDIRLQVLIPKNRSSRYIFLLPILSILISTQFLPHRTTTLFTARCERLHSSHMPLPDGPPSLLFIDHSIRLLEASHFAANALCHPELNPQLSVWLSVPNRRRFYRHRKGE